MPQQNEFMIKFTSTFKGIRVIDDELHPSTWKLTTDIVTNPKVTDPEFNLAINKVKFFLEQIVDNGIFFSSSNKWAINSFVNKASNIPILCPYDPGDDHLALLLTSKINALANGAFTAGFLEVTSDTAGGLTFMFVGEDKPQLPSMQQWIGKRAYFDEPWWNRDDGSTLDTTPKRGADLTNKPDFAFDLDFLKDHMGEVKKEEEKVVRPSKFKPKVITGKKKD